MDAANKKNKKTWDYITIYPVYVEEEGNFVVDDDELSDIAETLEADPNAVMINGYYMNGFGSQEEPAPKRQMVQWLKKHYEWGMYPLMKHFELEVVK